MKLKISIRLIGFIFVMLTCISCEKFLDSKPNSKSVIPRKISDLRALLDNSGQINIYTVNGLLEHYSDYLRIDDEDLKKLPVINHEFYTFGQNYEQDGALEGAWTGSHRAIYIANTVLDLFPLVEGHETEEGARVKGTAHFLRANYMFHLVKIFSPLYIKGNQEANSKLSIPIRLNSDVTVVSKRETVSEVYNQIVEDFKKAIQLLPQREQFLTRPDKASAYACLARLYLTMQEYELAGAYADSSLRIHRVLMDYNEIDRASPVPFSELNSETLFFAASLSMPFTSPFNGAYIDPDLVASYDFNDLRKEAYFVFDVKGRPQFKGNYLGQHFGSVLPDPAVDEMFLTRAEGYARSGKVALAMESLNDLLEKRWRKGKFVPFSTNDPDLALQIILQERKKSLIFRGTRMLDQRRLNLDSRFAQPIRRTLGVGSERKEYLLPANDPRYVFLIPKNVMEITGMPQNPR